MSKRINPALKMLAFLEGDWRMKISNASFLDDPKATLNGSASFEWFEDGDFLILRQGIKDSGATWATWLIGRDQDTENYTVLYIDEKSSSRVYEMSFEGDTWKIWRDAPGFVQSFEGNVNKDQKTITGAWGKSADGEKWEHDFDLVYERVN